MCHHVPAGGEEGVAGPDRPPPLAAALVLDCPHGLLGLLAGHGDDLQVRPEDGGLRAGVLPPTLCPAPARGEREPDQGVGRPANIYMTVLQSSLGNMRQDGRR